MATRWPRDIWQDIQRNLSRHVRAAFRQQPGSGSNAADCPSRRPARQPALWEAQWRRNIYGAICEAEIHLAATHPAS